MAMTKHHDEGRLSRSDMQRLPAVQAMLAIEHKARPLARPALTVVPSAPGMPEAEQTAGPLHPVAHWVLMPTSGGNARLEMVWETPDPLPLNRDR